MEAVRQLGEGHGVGGLAPGDELGHIVPAGKLERAGKLAVQRVLYDHVHHGTALVHNGVELGLHGLAAVADGHPAEQTLAASLDAVAPWGSQDLLAACPQQGDVPHDDLATDGKLSRQD